ncbi:hypothetical protein SAMN04487905_10382 [Actinopolyspora xinjiangensis]|uniref:Uncharacterized protein n=1 Tax=Actinopolyspora xinjiangensis TaxID=405564 RepID=A0A1H0RIG1_9ACTN|nr:hypothetical protein [Actinopolyspora xinjiangensis]SDP29304.1 hypothetical protein SAMN04487905_10382 [Actinopolyspora xinjiangensis]
MTDEVTGCACCGPRAEDEIPPEFTVGAVPSACRAGSETAGVPSDDSPAEWAPWSCETPTARQSALVAEFDALFTGALRTFDRPEPNRLRLVLDPAWQDTARLLAEREGRCCSVFTFVLRQHGDELHLDIAVPASQRPVLDALAWHAAETATKGTR